jgi:hypothetical protein
LETSAAANRERKKRQRIMGRGRNAALNNTPDFAGSAGGFLPDVTSFMTSVRQSMLENPLSVEPIQTSQMIIGGSDAPVSLLLSSTTATTTTTPTLTLPMEEETSQQKQQEQQQDEELPATTKAAQRIGPSVPRHVYLLNKRRKRISEFERKLKSVEPEEPLNERLNHLLELEANLQPNHPLNWLIAGAPPPPSHVAALIKMVDSTRGLAYNSSEYFNTLGKFTANLTQQIKQSESAILKWLRSIEHCILSTPSSSSSSELQPQSHSIVSRLVFDFCVEAITESLFTLSAYLLEGFRQLQFYAKREFWGVTYSSWTCCLQHLEKMQDIHHLWTPQLEQERQLLHKSLGALFYEFMPLLLTSVKEERIILEKMQLTLDAREKDLKHKQERKQQKLLDAKINLPNNEIITKK